MEEKIKSLILKNYGVQINSKTHLIEVAEDSLSMIELLYELEKELNFSISHDEILEIETFGDLINLLEKTPRSNK